VVSQLRRLVLEREQRERRKIDQIDIARETGLTPNTVSRWMGFEPFERIEVKAMVALARYLGLENPFDLLEYIPPANSVGAEHIS